jgi:hypothetical protein
LIDAGAKPADLRVEQPTKFDLVEPPNASPSKMLRSLLH